MPLECMVGRFHHGRRATTINLIGAEVRMVLQHGLMHETAAALPSILGQWLRQYRDIAELRMLRLPLLRQCIHVQVLA